MAVKSVRAILLATNDNVAATLRQSNRQTPVAVALNSSGETVGEFSSEKKSRLVIRLQSRTIATGSPIVRYGYSIGVATADIKRGEHVHSHNMRSHVVAGQAPKTSAREIRHGRMGTSASWRSFY